MQLLELILLAALAILVLARLYMVLGRGPRPEQRRAPARDQSAEGAADGFARKPAPVETVRPRPLFTGPAADGLEAIAARDGQFDPEEFVQGARAAYSMIVRAFAQGDRETLRPLLTPDVFATYDQAIRDRAGKVTTEIVRIRHSNITAAEIVGDTARVTVRFESDLDTGDEHRLVDAREDWTFERRIEDTDPNWRLAAVANAT